MKYLFTTLFLSSYSLFLYGQGKNASFGDKYFFSEFNVSINRTSFYIGNEQQRLGFGVGVNRIFGEKRKLNLVLGFEYNLTRMLVEEHIVNHFQDYREKRQYNIQCMSLPLSLRCVFGNKVKFFVESGVYIEIGNYPNYGVLFGSGLRIPAKKNEFIIKTDYKFSVLPFFSHYDAVWNCYLRLSIGYKIW